MNKPIYLHQDTWDFLLSRYREIPDENLHQALGELGYDIVPKDTRDKMLERVAEEPSAFLLSVGLLDNPDQMESMILRLKIDDDRDISMDYLITPEAVQALKDNAEFVILDMIGGPAKDLAVTREVLAKNLSEHCEIDYLERK